MATIDVSARPGRPVASGLAARFERSRSLLRPESALLVAVALALGYLVLTPLAVLIVSSFRRYELAGSIAFVFTLENYRETYLTPTFLEALRNSAVYAAGGSAVALVFGVALAWVVERTNAPLRGLFTACAGAQFFVPGVLATLAWTLLLSPRTGLLNTALRVVVPVSVGPLDVNTMGGMIWVSAAQSYPLAFLALVAGFQTMDPSLEEAAAMSGGGTWDTLRRITLAISLPALVSSVLILFVRGLESFEVPLMIGTPGRIRVLTTEIYNAAAVHQPPEFGLSAALSMVLLVLSGLGVFFYQRATARARAFATIGGKGYRPRRIDLGRARYLVALACLAFFSLTLLLPLLALVWVSFFPFVAPPSLDALSRASLANYAYVFSYGGMLDAFRNSLVNSALVATAVVLITAAAAWIAVRSRLPGRALVDGLAFLPIAMPGAIVGVSIMLVYLTLPVPVYGTLLIISIAHVTMFLPYGMRLASDALLRVHPELEEAAALSGASWTQAYRRILVPLLVPGLLAAWVYVVGISFRELSAAIFLVGPNSRLVSVFMYSLWKDGNTTTAATLGIVVLGVLVLVTTGARLIARRAGVAAGS